MNAATQAIPPAPLFFRHLQIAMMMTEALELWQLELRGGDPTATEGVPGRTAVVEIPHQPVEWEEYVAEGESDASFFMHISQMHISQ